MATRRVLVEMGYTPSLAAAALTSRPLTADSTVVPSVPTLIPDPSFPPTAIPGQSPRTRAESVYDPAPFDLTVEPELSTYVVRAEVDSERIDDLRSQPQVIGVFADPVIQPTIVCPGSAPVGTDADVERLLCTAALRSNGLDGLGVLVAIVDTGINLAYLNSRGKSPSFDVRRSWVPPGSGLTPGSLPVDHGTMCAYDACIAAPRCTLLDVAVLRSTSTGPTAMSGLLSDAVSAYRHLIDLMLAPRRPGESRSLVVNNSWGMFDPAWDFPPGHPGNYSDNPNHPFNRIVAELDRAGADILFAAGNCGADCPDSRCRGVTNAIYGANGHPVVLCVAGVDTTKARVGYSTTGPGRLTRNKPDISGYTHFRGSGVYTADGGTSAATPVVAGVVAAVRSKRPYDGSNPSTHPAAIRALLTSTAEDLGTAGYDFQHGFGVVNGCELARRFAPPATDLCRRYPWLCSGGGPIDICRRFPWLCRRIPPIPPVPPVPPFPPGPDPIAAGVGLVAPWWQDAGPESGSADLLADPIELAYLLGYSHGQQEVGGRTSRGATGGDGCGCGKK